MNKRNLPLYIALAIPVLMILLVAAFIYLPGIGKYPQQNFIYETGSALGNYDGYPAQYEVLDGRITQPAVPTSTMQIKLPAVLSNPAQLYLYNVKTNTASQITLAQTEQYTLDVSNTSSDGYTVEQGNYSGGEGLFGGGVSSDYSDWFLKGHNRSTKLNLKLSSGNYYNNFQFLGWIIN